MPELEATCMAQNTNLHFVKQRTKGLNILTHGQFIPLERSVGKFCHCWWSSGEKQSQQVETVSPGQQLSSQASSDTAQKTPEQTHCTTVVWQRERLASRDYVKKIWKPVVTTSSVFLGKMVYCVKKCPVTLQNSGQMPKPAPLIIYTDPYWNLSRVAIPRRGGVGR